MKMIDLRSDTLTKPTPEMYKAMCEADIGDDQNEEDPSVIKLQRMAAEKLGKEAGLFVTSGTMGNLVALLTHAKPGDSVILDAESHIFRTEAGGISAVAGAVPKRVPGRLGVPTAEQIEEAIIGEGRLFPTTTLICLENTHNAAGGTCVSVSRMKEIRKVANRHGLKIHIDGARIFNAAIALRANPQDLVMDADSVQFCLSKGLGCPFGSVLVGTKEFIERARKKRQMVGGGMRQAGVMAAAGIIALVKMIDRLEEDHKHARILAENLLELGFEIDMDSVQTNIVFFRVPPSIMDPPRLTEELKKIDILIGSPRGNRIRIVTHKDISMEDISYAIEGFRKVIKS